MRGNGDLARRALRVNAGFSAVSGSVLALGASGLRTWFGLDSAWPLVAIGVGLGIFAVALWRLAGAPDLTPAAVWQVVALDVGWIVATIVLTIVDPFGMTTAGLVAILVVADIVALLAVAQAVGARRLPPTVEAVAS